MAVVWGLGINGELCLVDKSDTALVKSLLNSSSSSQSVRPLNCHWSLRREAMGDDGLDVDVVTDCSSSDTTDSAISSGGVLLVMEEEGDPL
eukprot:scaffold75346_cov62-Cyclotella_meneghiniana.AAC.5